MIKVAEVIVPLAAPKAYTYAIPSGMDALLHVGSRVEVQFGRKKIYSGIVKEIKEVPAEGKLKPIIHVLDAEPVVHQHNIAFWDWMANYYLCTIGEVMLAALPGAMKMSSETVIVKSSEMSSIPAGLSDDAYLIAEALEIQQRIKLEEAYQILGKRSVMPVFQELIAAEFAWLEEEIKEKYKPRIKQFVRLDAAWRAEESMNELFEKCARSEKQTRALLSYFQLVRKQAEVSKEELMKVSDTDTATMKALESKGILVLYDKQVSRLSVQQIQNPELAPLSDFQEEALREIGSAFQAGKPCLLRGVTGSGKTRIYQELIKKVLDEGGQVLYLLPEISLTAQMEQRLSELYGSSLMVYHSRLNANKRVEIWKKMYEGHQLIVGARSALFLPFKKLSLVIVDEEHDPSYKQQDPMPRYHGRDAAIYLAHMTGASVILGSATPSVESRFQAVQGKYAYVEMLRRFGASVLPVIEIVDMVQARKQGRMTEEFSTVLLEEIERTIQAGDKVILFQNRRGYAPIMECELCHWKSECIHCDVSLTYHKFSNKLKCHYCGYHTVLPEHCPDCGSHQLKLKGFGTEKIEDELKIFLPEVKVGRLDADTAGGKSKLESILDRFETGEIQILVGTQMITKGLDFEGVGLVGVLNADQSLHFPDFRAAERTFQLITQVAGRSGRRDKQGKVLIQAHQLSHPVIQEIVNHDFEAHFNREMNERRLFAYPPFTRLIRITLKHPKAETCEKAAHIMAHGLESRLKERVKGPALASIPRINNQYIYHILLKLEKKSSLLETSRQLIAKGMHYISAQKGLSTVRISVDVDPI